MDSANALATLRKEARENPSWLAAMMINLNGFELETPSIPRNFGLGSASILRLTLHGGEIDHERSGPKISIIAFLACALTGQHRFS